MHGSLCAFNLGKLIEMNFKVDTINVELRELFFMICKLLYISHLINFSKNLNHFFLFALISHYNPNNLYFIDNFSYKLSLISFFAVCKFFKFFFVICLRISIII